MSSKSARPTPTHPVPIRRLYWLTATVCCSVPTRLRCTVRCMETTPATRQRCTKASKACGNVRRPACRRRRSACKLESAQPVQFGFTEASLATRRQIEWRLQGRRAVIDQHLTKCRIRLQATFRAPPVEPAAAAGDMSELVALDVSENLDDARFVRFLQLVDYQRRCIDPARFLHARHQCHARQ